MSIGALLIALVDVLGVVLMHVCVRRFERQGSAAREKRAVKAAQRFKIVGLQVGNNLEGQQPLM